MELGLWCCFELLSQSINCLKKRPLIRLFELTLLAGTLDRLGAKLTAGPPPCAATRWARP